MSLLEMYVQALLGKTGMFLYEHMLMNKLFICSVVVIYGFFLTIGAYNLKRVLPRKTDHFIRKTARLLREQKRDLDKEELVSSVLSEWKAMVDGLPKTCFILGQREYWIIFPDSERYAQKLQVDRHYVHQLIEKYANNR